MLLGTRRIRWRESLLAAAVLGAATSDAIRIAGTQATSTTPGQQRGVSFQPPYAAGR